MRHAGQAWRDHQPQDTDPPSLGNTWGPASRAPQGPSSAARGSRSAPRRSGRILKAGLDSQGPQGICTQRQPQISPGTIFKARLLPRTRGRGRNTSRLPRHRAGLSLLSARCPRPQHREAASTAPTAAGDPGLWVRRVRSQGTRRQGECQGWSPSSAPCSPWTGAVSGPREPPQTIVTQ